MIASASREARIYERRQRGERGAARRGGGGRRGETRESAIADKSRRGARPDNAPLSLSSGAATLKAPCARRGTRACFCTRPPEYSGTNDSPFLGPLLRRRTFRHFFFCDVLRPVSGVSQHRSRLGRSAELAEGEENSQGESRICELHLRASHKSKRAKMCVKVYF